VANLPQIFAYEDKPVRVVIINGEPWFVAKDVCEILELENSRQAVARLDEDERGVCIIDTPGGPQEMQIVNEPGLYAMILTSRKPEAKQFRRWITHEVIPTIRKTGIYSTQYQIPRTYAEALRLAAEQAEMIERQQRELEAAKPKIEFFDAVASSKDAIQIGDAAKVLGIPGLGRNKLFAFLREKGILMHDNVPYQEYVDRGYFRVIEQKWTTPDGETRISIKTLVYQRGLDFIRRLLAEERKSLRVIKGGEQGA
jgi:prophage antirepressor-like protein